MESAQFMNEDEINIALITWIYDNQAKAVFFGRFGLAEKIKLEKLVLVTAIGRHKE